MTTNERDRQAARRLVVADLCTEVAHRQRIIKEFPRGAVGDAYRREILRLWRIALKAVEKA